MSTSNLKHMLCNSGVMDGSLVKMCGKTGDGMCRLVGDAFSIGSSPGLCQWAGVSPTGQPEGSHFPWTPLFRSPVKTDWFCLSPAGNYSNYPSLDADSSASQSNRECLMRLMGSCYVCCTPGLACSAPSADGLQLSPCSGPPFHTRGSGSSHWSSKGCLGHVCHQSHNFWGFRWGYHMEELETFW